MIQEALHIHAQVLQRFAVLIRNNRLAHAYLLAGPPRVGKKATALGLSQMINCECPVNDKQKEEFFCGQCAACLKIQSGNHPDVRLMEGAGEESIKIEQIRELLEQVRMRPYEGKKKIFIILGVEQLTSEAANAFLKTLEEPTPTSLLLLTSSAPDNILETIQSRCHRVNFYPLAQNTLALRLRERLGEDVKQAHFYAYFSDGCLGQAQRFRDENIFDRKNEMIDRFILKQGDEAFTKKILDDDESARQFLNVLLSWSRDSLLLKSGAADQQLIHLDRIGDLRNFTDRHSFEELVSLEQEIVSMRRMWAENLNIKIPLAIIRASIRNS